MGASEPFADVPDRRNVRAGDDGESAGGSGISHANAAGETDGGSADAGDGTLEGGRPEGTAPDDAAPDDAAPDDGRPEGTVLEGEVSAPDGFVPDSAGSAAAVVGWAGAGGGLKLNADES